MTVLLVYGGLYLWGNQGSSLYSSLDSSCGTSVVQGHRNPPSTAAPLTTAI
jgi:hypothetical protein